MLFLLWYFIWMYAECFLKYFRHKVFILFPFAASLNGFGDWKFGIKGIVFLDPIIMGF